MVLSAQTPYRGQENLWEHYEPDVIWMPLAGEKSIVNFGTGGFTDGRQRTRDMYFMSA